MNEFRAWEALLTHIGRSLKPFHKHPAEWLGNWLAHCVQRPEEKLPYLFIYGPPACGKSLFGEAVQALLPKKTVYGQLAIDKNAWNSEIKGKTICILEEFPRPRTVLFRQYVSSADLTIHEPTKHPAVVQNQLHWIHIANTIDELPAYFPNGLQLLRINDNSLPFDNLNTKTKILKILAEENSGFLKYLSSLKLSKELECV